jgi:hypothetical protein
MPLILQTKVYIFKNFGLQRYAKIESKQIFHTLISKNFQTTLVGIINKGSDVCGIGYNTFGNLGSGQVSGTQPDDFGRKASEYGDVEKIGVKSHNSKTVLFCISPYLHVVAVIVFTHKLDESPFGQTGNFGGLSGGQYSVGVELACKVNGNKENTDKQNEIYKQDEIQRNWAEESIRENQKAADGADSFHLQKFCSSRLRLYFCVRINWLYNVLSG